MSPAAARTVCVPRGWRRWISLNRAREPYDAETISNRFPLYILFEDSRLCFYHDEGGSSLKRKGTLDNVPRLSAANMIPPSNRNPMTEVPVTSGCLPASALLFFSLLDEIIEWNPAHCVCETGAAGVALGAMCGLNMSKDALAGKGRPHAAGCYNVIWYSPRTSSDTVSWLGRTSRLERHAGMMTIEGILTCCISVS